MIVSTARVNTLIEFSELETELEGADRDIHAEDVEIFLDVLYEEATADGQQAYEEKLADLPEEDYPWSAVRARHYFEPVDTWGKFEKLITHAPPAISLAIARRPELEPELPGDEIDEEESKYAKLFNSIYTWDRNHLLRSMGPVGWLLADDTDEIVEAAKEAAVEAKGDIATGVGVAGRAFGEAAEGVAEAAADAVSAAGSAAWKVARPFVYGGAALLTLGVGVVVYRAVRSPEPRVIVAPAPGGGS